MSVTVHELAARLADRLRRQMPAGSRLDRLATDLETAFTGAVAPVDDAGCRAVQALAQRHARHLELHFHAGREAAAADEAGGWPPPDPLRVQAQAAGVTQVRRDDDRFVLQLDALEPLGLAAPYVDAAFTLARGASRLVLDLRRNGGGDPATVAAVAGRLLGDDATHLSDVTYRDRVRQWWTPDLPAGTALTQPLAVLVSGHTYSSAEALAYHLQARGRAVVVGEPTRGAADHVTPVWLTPEVLCLLPEAEVRDARTGTNWEGTGVIPDIACPAAEALENA
ncbi:S41 family peptidase [Nucisporomicrobium flavum]|uniref:S41 family peptidase n=1 Tax=Nucisporomicrobium flavum TaxID=2785915 RepID=UPI0018F7C4B4|nr:S41 family peptidase [Nucisporomicrobium flavum]